MSGTLPIPPSGVTFIDPITGGVSVQWQNYLLQLSSIGGGFAPIDARYWVSASDGTLTNETNLGALTTGYMKLTVAGAVGTPSTVTAIPGSDITGAALSTANDTNMSLTAGGTPLTGLLRAVSLTLAWIGKLGLARGGTNADLSATGGTHQVLQQASAGAAVTVGQLTAADISGLTTGTVTSVALTVPGGFSISGSPVTTSGTLALAASGTSGGVPYYSGAATMASSAALASTALVVGGGAGAAPATNSNFTINATSNFLSSSTQGRCCAYNSTVQGLTNNTETVVTFDSEDFDIGGFHSTSSDTSKFTIPTGGDGFYMMVGATRFAGAAAGAGALRFQKNGTTGIQNQANVIITTESLVLQCTAFAALVATDYIELLAYQDTGGNLDIGFATRKSASAVTLVKLW